MSQHIFKTTSFGRKCSVLMGWDRPLQGHFLVLENLDSEKEGYLYDNLSDPKLIEWGGHPPTVDYFVEKLAEFGISPPETMIQAIKEDARLNVGNKLVHYA